MRCRGTLAAVTAALALAGCAAVPGAAASSTSTCGAVRQDVETTYSKAEAAGKATDWESVRVIARMVVNNPSCFKASEVAVAQEFLDSRGGKPLGTEIFR